MNPQHPPHTLHQAPSEVYTNMATLGTLPRVVIPNKIYFQMAQ